MDNSHIAGRGREPPFSARHELYLMTTPDQADAITLAEPTPVFGAKTECSEVKATDLNSDVSIPGHAVLIESNLENYLLGELSVDKINVIHSHLWWAGRPGNTRPLHRQKMMHRNIIITECPNLHLVWYDSTIYIKPMPEFLLDHAFFRAHLCSNEKLYMLACGFLLSYSNLVLHKSDFTIALELGLLPSGTTWPGWCSFVTEISSIHGPVQVNKRYKYGELRLRRLNHIYHLSQWKMAYHSVYTQYDHYFTQKFAWLLLVFAYLTVVLTAMQVVLTTPGATEVFKNASYWLGIVSVIIVALVASVVLVLFVLLFTYNMVITLRHKHEYRLVTRKTGQWPTRRSSSV